MESFEAGIVGTRDDVTTFGNNGQLTGTAVCLEVYQPTHEMFWPFDVRQNYRYVCVEGAVTDAESKWVEVRWDHSNTIKDLIREAMSWNTADSKLKFESQAHALLDELPEGPTANGRAEFYKLVVDV